MARRTPVLVDSRQEVRRGDSLEELDVDLLDDFRGSVNSPKKDRPRSPFFHQPCGSGSGTPFRKDRGCNSLRVRSLIGEFV